jgi:hypothetical protein
VCVHMYIYLYGDQGEHTKHTHPHVHDMYVQIYVCIVVMYRAFGCLLQEHCITITRLKAYFVDFQNTFLYGRNTAYTLPPLLPHSPKRRELVKDARRQHADRVAVQDEGPGHETRRQSALTHSTSTCPLCPSAYTCMCPMHMPHAHARLQRATLSRSAYARTMHVCMYMHMYMHVYMYEYVCCVCLFVCVCGLSVCVCVRVCVGMNDLGFSI